MHATRGELEFSLDDLEGRLPKLIRDHVAVEDFWGVFHAYADPIVEDASHDDFSYALGRIQAMLEDKGLASPFALDEGRRGHDPD